MARSALGLRVPEGMHDLLPEELFLQEQLEQKILRIFRDWSYQKVMTPTLEFGACVETDPDRENHLYKFFDKQGHILALRPELTIPIARMVSTRLKGAQLPLRLCYGADVYRNNSARHREFRQVGVELVGTSSELADAEAIALSVEAIKALEVKDFQVNLGHMGIFAELMKEAGAGEEFQAKLENALGRKDIVKVEALVQESHLSSSTQELILRLPYLHGKEEILDDVSDLSKSSAIKKAVEGLRKVFGYLEDFGVQEHVALDMGILRGFSYYTGVIFEGYVPGVGIPVVEGGRYDGLYEEFGYPLAATGFALHLGSVLEQFSPPVVKNADVLVYGSDFRKVIELSQKLRKEGQKVEMALENMDQNDALRLAGQKNIAACICAD